MNLSHRAVGAALVATLVLSGASTGHADGRREWSGAWAGAQHRPWHNEWDGPNWSLGGFADQSIRQVVRITTGGTRVRVRLSNRYGTRPLRVGGATVAKTGDGARVRPGTMRRLTFGGSPEATIPAGRDAISDAASLVTAPLERLTVTLYLTRPTGPATFHEGGMTTTYRAGGNHVSDAGADAFAGETSHSWYYLTGVDVAGGRPRGAVAAFGDSITDGFGSTPGADNRYPDELAERLAAAGTPRGVLNAGINGNMLLTDSSCAAGEKALTRFGRDALDRPAVRAVVVLLGTNDIGLGGLDFGCGEFPEVTARRLIAGHRALIRMAHARGVTVIGATVTPFKPAQPYYSTTHEAVRTGLNRWIRHSGEYDAVVDLDRVLAEPADPQRLRTAYDSGDHLHPNDAGTRAIAAAIDLTLRRTR